MQKLTILGNLGKAPEEKFTNSGTKLITFSIAVTVKKGVTAWYDCNIWEKRIPLFERLLPYLKKGSKVIIFGDFPAVDTYQDKTGDTRVRLKIEPLSIDFAGSSSEGKPETQDTLQSSPSPDQFEINDIGF